MKANKQVRRTWLQLTDELGISRGTMSNWKKEDGSPKMPDLDAWIDWIAKTSKRAGISRMQANDEDVIAIVKSETAGAWQPPEDEEQIENIGQIALPGKCPYDKYVAMRAISYAEARVREQVIGCRLDNEKTQVAIEREKKSLITKAEAIASMTLLRNKFEEAIKTAPSHIIRAMNEAGLSIKQKDTLNRSIESVMMDICRGLVAKND